MISAGGGAFVCPGHKRLSVDGNYRGARPRITESVTEPFSEA